MPIHLNTATKTMRLLLVTALLSCGIFTSSAVFAQDMQAIDDVVLRAGSVEALLSADHQDTLESYYLALRSYFGDGFEREGFDVVVAQLRVMVAEVPGFGARLWETTNLGEPIEVQVDVHGVDRNTGLGALEEFQDFSDVQRGSFQSTTTVTIDFRPCMRRLHGVWTGIVEGDYYGGGDSEARNQATPRRWSVSAIGGAAVHFVEINGLFAGHTTLVPVTRDGDRFAVLELNSLIFSHILPARLRESAFSQWASRVDPSLPISAEGVLLREAPLTANQNIYRMPHYLLAPVLEDEAAGEIDDPLAEAIVAASSLVEEGYVSEAPRRMVIEGMHPLEDDEISDDWDGRLRFLELEAAENMQDPSFVRAWLHSDDPQQRDTMFELFFGRRTDNIELLWEITAMLRHETPAVRAEAADVLYRTHVEDNQLAADIWQAIASQPDLAEQARLSAAFAGVRTTDVGVHRLLVSLFERQVGQAEADMRLEAEMSAMVDEVPHDEGDPYNLESITEALVNQRLSQPALLLRLLNFLTTERAGPERQTIVHSVLDVLGAARVTDENVQLALVQMMRQGLPAMEGSTDGVMEAALEEALEADSAADAARSIERAANEAVQPEYRMNGVMHVLMNSKPTGDAVVAALLQGYHRDGGAGSQRCLRVLLAASPPQAHVQRLFVRLLGDHRHAPTIIPFTGLTSIMLADNIDDHVISDQAAKGLHAIEVLNPNTVRALERLAANGDERTQELARTILASTSAGSGAEVEPVDAAIFERSLRLLLSLRRTAAVEETSWIESMDTFLADLLGTTLGQRHLDDWLPVDDTLLGDLGEAVARKLGAARQGRLTESRLAAQDVAGMLPLLTFDELRPELSKGLAAIESAIASAATHLRTVETTRVPELIQLTRTVFRR